MTDLFWVKVIGNAQMQPEAALLSVTAAELKARQNRHAVASFFPSQPKAKQAKQLPKVLGMLRKVPRHHKRCNLVYGSKTLCDGILPAT